MDNGSRFNIYLRHGLKHSECIPVFQLPKLLLLWFVCEDYQDFHSRPGLLFYSYVSARMEASVSGFPPFLPQYLPYEHSPTKEKISSILAISGLHKDVHDLFTALYGIMPLV